MLKYKKINFLFALFFIFIFYNTVYAQNVFTCQDAIYRIVRDSRIIGQISSLPDRSELLNYSQLTDLKSRQSGEMKEISQEVEQAIRKKLKGLPEEEYGMLLGYLLPSKFGRILLKIDEEGDSLTYNLEDGVEVLSWLDFGSEGIVDGRKVSAGDGNDIFAYVHITKALYERYKDNPDVLAQIVIRQYHKSFLQDYILNPDYAEIRKNFMNEIDKRKGNHDPFSSLVELLRDYNPDFDTMGVAKNKLLDSILDAFRNDPASIIVGGEELLGWYRAQLEAHSGLQDVAKITEEINRLMAAGKIVVGGRKITSIEQARRYLFTYKPTNPGENQDRTAYNNGNPVYLPHSIYKPGAMFAGDVYSVDEKAVHELYNESERIRQRSSSEDEAVEDILKYIISSNLADRVPLLKLLAEDIKRIRENTPPGETPMYSEYALNVDLDKVEPVVGFLEHAIFDNNLILAIVEKIKSRAFGGKVGPVVISVMGPQGGGKSTFCQFLRLAARDKLGSVEKAAIEKNMLARGFRYAQKLSYELTYLEDGSSKKVKEEGVEMRGNGMYDWELIKAQLEAINNGETVFNPDTKEDVDFSKVNVFIFDGPLTQHGIDLPGLVDISITLAEVESRERMLRRLKRDVIHPEGKKFTESYFINEFAQKQFHQERDIQRIDTIKDDGSNIVLVYGYDLDEDMIYWRTERGLFSQDDF